MPSPWRGVRQGRALPRGWSVGSTHRFPTRGASSPSASSARLGASPRQAGLGRVRAGKAQTATGTFWPLLSFPVYLPAVCRGRSYRPGKGIATPPSRPSRKATGSSSRRKLEFAALTRPTHHPAPGRLHRKDTPSVRGNRAPPRAKGHADWLKRVIYCHSQPIPRLCRARYCPRPDRSRAPARGLRCGHHPRSASRVTAQRDTSCLPSPFNRAPSPDTSKVQLQDCKAQQQVKMGFIFSKSMNENMKNQQEFMVTHARLQLERQLTLQNEMRERQMAVQIAWSREFLKYFGTFFSIATISLTAGAIKQKKPAFLAPILPLSFIFVYQYDLGYGTLLQRMKSEAEGILETEKTKLELPKGMITFESLEKARREQGRFLADK